MCGQWLQRHLEPLRSFVCPRPSLWPHSRPIGVERSRQALFHAISSQVAASCDCVFSPSFNQCSGASIESKLVPEYKHISKKSVSQFLDSFADLTQEYMAGHRESVIDAAPRYDGLPEMWASADGYRLGIFRLSWRMHGDFRRASRPVALRKQCRPNPQAMQRVLRCMHRCDWCALQDRLGAKVR